MEFILSSHIHSFGEERWFHGIPCDSVGEGKIDKSVSPTQVWVSKMMVFGFRVKTNKQTKNNGTIKVCAKMLIIFSVYNLRE